MQEDRAIDSLLAVYRESHMNPTNELIHCVCIPLIVFSLLGLLWAVHPVLALAFVVGSMLYYLKLSRPFAVGMLVAALASLAILNAMHPATVLPASLAIFVVSWIGQFIGHKIEGKKPSFFDDLRFLLIGPLFVLSFLYKRLNLAW